MTNTSMIIEDRRAQLLDGTIKLHRSSHLSFEDGHCAMEVVAWLAGEGHTDAPACASPVLTRYTIRLNDRWSHEQRQALAPYLKADGYVVSAQNGLNELVIQEVVGKARTMGCFVNFGADYLEPGLIIYAGRGAVVLGELDGQMTGRLAELHGVFRQFEENAIITDNIWGYLWGKLAYGAQLFVTALTNDSIADALADERYQDVYIAIAQEVMRIALARGVTPMGFNGFDPSAFLPDTPRAVSIQSLKEMEAFNRKSAKSHSGIWRDLAVRKRKTEANDQLGPIVTLGAEVGVPAPLVARTIEMIHDIEDGRREMSHANLDALATLLPAKT